LHYYFREKPAQEVKLAFLDARGRVLREFSSKGVAPPQRSGVVYAVTSDVQAVTVPAEMGANRFVWNMRLPGAREVPGAAMWFGFLGGPAILPGTYQARLSVGNEIITQPFEIRRDPRISATDDELKEHFEFLLKVRDALTEVHAAVLSVRDIRAQIQQWVARAEGLSGSGALAGAAKELSSELDSIEDELIQWRAQAFEDTFHFPVRLNNKLATIADLTNMADAVPTRQVREVFGELRAHADAQLARLEAVKRGGCAMFSDALRELGVPPIRLLPAGE
ncbi:MAG TPA: glycosyl hydrolase, partial [bacterium]|nr:glycosyl hydrolase [bacterium]